MLVKAVKSLSPRRSRRSGFWVTLAAPERRAWRSRGPSSPRGPLLTSQRNRISRTELQICRHLSAPGGDKKNFGLEQKCLRYFTAGHKHPVADKVSSLVNSRPDMVQHGRVGNAAADHETRCSYLGVQFVSSLSQQQADHSLHLIVIYRQST